MKVAKKRNLKSYKLHLKEFDLVPVENQSVKSYILEDFQKSVENRTNYYSALYKRTYPQKKVVDSNLFKDSLLINKQNELLENEHEHLN